MKPDYLIVGSGLAFASLMAKAGEKVKVLEAHYLPGGYGHIFELGGISLMPNSIMSGIADQGEP